MTALPRAVGSLRTNWRPSSRSVREFEHDLVVFRRGFRSYVMSGVVQPTFFLLSMGIGMGVYVNRGGGTALGGVPYLVFVAPGLLVAQAMMTAAFESMHPIMGKIQWQKTYWAALNTPVGALDLLTGELAWIAFRLAIAAALFFAVMAVVGAVVSPLAVLAVPVAVLTGVAFATPIAAFTATQRRDYAFSAIMRFGVTPLFLFSGTFFPIEQLPLAVRPIAWLTPLYHGVALARDLSLGRVDLGMDALHLLVVLAFVVVGAVAASVTFRRRLEV